MPLYDILDERGAERTFILGMAKNAGKTFTLNRLVRAGTARHEVLGLTSTGRDGEAVDLVTGKAKPRIFCPEGAIIASARLALGAGTALLCDEEPTGIETVLGEVIVARVAREGYAELAGPLFAEDLRVLLDRMTLRGARRIFLDGSLDRKAAGRVVPHVVLAVGAVVSRRLEDVVRQARTYVEQIAIPPAPASVIEALASSSSAGAILYEDGGAAALPFSTLMGNHESLRDIMRVENPWGVYVAGAVGEEVFSSLIHQKPPPRLVVHNASSLFVRPADWRRFVDQGGVCYALRPLDLLAVTGNPYSPEGWEFPADEFTRALEEGLAPLPVFNLATQEA